MITIAGQPGAVRARRRPARPRARRRRLHGQRRPLPQRDHPPRRRRSCRRRRRRRAPHFDFALNNLAVRNNVRYSPPVLPLDGRPDEAEILSRLALILYGARAPTRDPVTRRRTGHRDDAGQGDRRSRLAGRGARSGRRADRDACRRPGYERRLDMMLRLGPYGDAFGAEARWADPANGSRPSPHGIDLGPLRPRLPEVLRTPCGRDRTRARAVDRRRRAAARRAGPTTSTASS